MFVCAAQNRFARARWIWILTACLLLLPADRWQLQAEDIRRDATVKAIEAVMPSVVNIRTETIIEYRDPFDRFFREFFDPYHRSQRGRYSLGSGVIIHESGYVLTNLHVVRRANRVQVVLSDGRVYEAEARFFAMEPSDVAVIKLKSQPGETFQAIKFGIEDDVHLGETVLALGNPFGLGGSVSKGIISSKRRIAPREHEELGIANWLQTDASINPGNSGGPLVNLNGELIAVNVATLQDAQGIGFAIPMEQINQALSEIFTPEIFAARWFGARFRTGHPLVVSTVQSGSPAEAAGLQAGDIVLQANGSTPGGVMDFNERMTAGESLDFALTVRRGERRVNITGQMVSFQEMIRQRLGLDAQELTQELAGGFGLAPHSGLLIAGIQNDGPADRAHLQPGFVITNINGERVSNLLAAANRVSGMKPGENVRVGVLAPQYARGNLAGFRQGVATLRAQ